MHRRIPATAALLVAVALAACSPAASGPAAAGGTAAAVNGQVILRAPIEEAVRLLVEADPSRDAAEFQRRLLTVEIQAAALDQLAAERGVVVDDERIAEVEAEIVDSVPDDASLDALLDQLGFTREFFTRILVPFEAKVGAMVEALSEDLVITEREVRHILVATQEEADEVYALVLGGADFAELAAERSLDPGSATQGGSLGASEPGRYVPEFEEVVWSALVGFVSPPVQTQFGFHVIQVTDERVVPTAGLSADEIRARVAPQVEQLIRERLAVSIVSVEPGLGRWDPETQQVVAAPAVGDGTTP